jgi:hypothetical protein
MTYGAEVTRLGAIGHGTEVTRLGAIGHGAEVGGQELHGWRCGADVDRARRHESRRRALILTLILR